MGVTAALGLTIAGGAVKAFGALQQGAAASAAAKYQAAVSRNLAQYTIMAGQVEEQQQRMKNNALISQQRAAFGASGLDVNVGSAKDIQISAQMLGELDALTIRSNARAKAATYLDQAALSSMEAASARKSGYIDAFSSILGTASSFSSKWNQFKTTGALASA